MDFVDAISEVSNEVVSRMDDDANDTIKFIGIRHMQFVKKYIHLWMTVACQTLSISMMVMYHWHHEMMDAIQYYQIYAHGPPDMAQTGGGGRREER